VAVRNKVNVAASGDVGIVLGERLIALGRCPGRGK
jgi:hypothetical protein